MRYAYLSKLPTASRSLKPESSTLQTRLRRCKAFLARHSASALAVLLTAAVQLIYTLSPPWAPEQGLMGNFLTEAYGIMVTIVLFERLLRVEENQRTQHARQVADYEFSKIYGICINIWGSLAGYYQASQERTTPAFDDAVHELVRQRDLREPAGVYPERPTFVHVRERTAELRQRINTAMLRYLPYAEMELIEALQKLEKCPFLQLADNIEVNLHHAQEFGVPPLFPLFAKDKLHEMFPVEALRLAINKSRRTMSPRKPDINPPMLGFRPQRPAPAAS